MTLTTITFVIIIYVQKAHITMTLQEIPPKALVREKCYRGGGGPAFKCVLLGFFTETGVEQYVATPPIVTDGQ